MSESAIINLGCGSFKKGFPNIVARVAKRGKRSEISWLQVRGTLPPAPEIPELYRNWRTLFALVYLHKCRTIEVEPAGVTNISVGVFDSLSEKLEARINGWLRDEGFRRIEEQLRTQLNASESFCVVLESDNDEIWRIPWHLWHFFKEDYRYGEIALSAPEYPSPVGDRRKATGNKVRILAILGDSTGIDTERDKALLDRLPGVEVKYLREPRREELCDRLWQEGWDILFFAGHGKSEENGTKGRIFINSGEGDNSLTMAELREAIAEARERGLQLGIFNCCDGLGLARDLAEAKLPLPHTIVMREAIPDVLAHEFLKTFLRSFSGGDSFHWAVRQAREQLKGWEGELPGASWLPTICQHPGAAYLTWESLRRGRRERQRSRFLPWRVGGLSLGALGVYLLAAPQLAIFLNQLGVENYLKGQTLQSEIYYDAATFFNPFYAKPYYNKGVICEELKHDLDCAIEAYYKAAKRGLPDAYAELSRLQIYQNT
ncbi:MAG: CHAT domain-containing protein, partial [Spirulina sp.]